MRLLLDTNTIIALFKNNKVVAQTVALAEVVFVPVVAVGELYYGAYNSTQPETNLARIAEFVCSNTILACGAETSRHYGQIKARLRANGTPIPENDIWIAAIALQYNLALFTRDAHFQQVDNLSSRTY